MSSQPKLAINNNWLSAYIFYESDQPDIYGSDCDRVIHHIVAPFVEQARANLWFSRYFYIRYSEQGNHVRLRFRGEVEQLKKLATALVDWVAVSAEKLALPMRVDWVAYEPETARYGGETPLLLAEDVFAISSDTTLRMLAKLIDSKRTARLGQALLLMSVLIYAFTDEREDGQTFARSYGMGYLQAMIPEAGRAHWLAMFNGGFDRQANTLIAYVHEVWDRLDDDDALTPLLDAYFGRMQTIRTRFEQLFNDRLIIVNGEPADDWLAAVRGVVSSYNHMTNNRLGVSIPEEMYLAYLIARALEQQQPATASAS